VAWWQRRGRKRRILLGAALRSRVREVKAQTRGSRVGEVEAGDFVLSLSNEGRRMCSSTVQIFLQADPWVARYGHLIG
jgi:hypothetical protein